MLGNLPPKNCARRSDRSDPDSRPGSKSRCRSRNAGRTQTQNSRHLRNRKGPGQAKKIFHESAAQVKPPKKLADRFQEAVKQEQLRDLENFFYAVGDDRDPFAKNIVHLTEKLGEKYQVDELAGKYDFTGRQSMTVPKALEIKEELELIDKLLQQIEEAKKTAQIGMIDMEELSEFADAGQMEELRALQQQINEYLREQAERQGIMRDRKGFQLSPKAFRLFQSRLLTHDLQSAAGFSNRPASRGRRRRRSHRDAADQALRIRRFRLAHGHPGLDDQCPVAARGRHCRFDSEWKTSSSIAPARIPSVPPRCCST